MKNRPEKKSFPKEIIESLREQAIEKIKSRFLPDNKIIKIMLIGSVVKDTFGKYEPPGFRGSLYSDFDFIIFVDNDYPIPKWLDRQPEGKPFPDDTLNLAYRIKKFIEDKYDAEVFFIRKRTMENPKIQELGEQAGIPMTSKSKHKHLVIYSK